MEKPIVIIDGCDQARRDALRAAIDKLQKSRLAFDLPVVVFITDESLRLMPGIHAAVIARQEQVFRDECRGTIDLVRLKESFRGLSDSARVSAEEIKAFGREIEQYNPPVCKPLKSYRQRGFCTQPGSRQDKYSRSKR